MGIEDESNLSQPDFCEKTKKLNMSTTRVEMSRTQVLAYSFEIPTYVAEWFKENPGNYPAIETPHGEDYWELYWGERGMKMMRIKRGEMEQMNNDYHDVEYEELDEAEELRKKAEFWEKRAKSLEAELDEVNPEKRERLRRLQEEWASLERVNQ